MSLRDAIGVLVPKNRGPSATDSAETEGEEAFRFLTLGQLMWRKFLRNRAAVLSGVALLIIYLVMVLADFFAPYDMTRAQSDYLYCPPQPLRFIDATGRFSLRPFVYPVTGERDLETFRFIYTEDRTRKAYVHLFVQGDPYTLFGREFRLKFFGVKEGTIFLLGTDIRGRDQLSRIIMGSRISLTLGLVGVIISVFLGSVIGTLSGYFGGLLDDIIQRVIEFIRSFPTLPLWMALSAALAPTWPSHLVYLGIVVVLSFIGWTSLAREVRALAGMAYDVQQGRSRDSAMAAHRIWESRKPLVGRALQRADLSHWQRLLRHCAHADRVIKGQARGAAWDELQTLVLAMSGAPDRATPGLVANV